MTSHRHPDEEKEAVGLLFQGLQPEFVIAAIPFIKPWIAEPEYIRTDRPVRPNIFRLRNPWFDEWNRCYDELGLESLKKQTYGFFLFVRMSVGSHRLGSAKTMRVYRHFARHALPLLPKYIYYRLF